MRVGGRVSGGIDRRCGGVWDCRKVAYKPGLVIGLVHRSNAGVTEVGSKVGKSAVNRENDAETVLHHFMDFITNKYSGLRCEH